MKKLTSTEIKRSFWASENGKKKTFKKTQTLILKCRAVPNYSTFQCSIGGVLARKLSQEMAWKLVTIIIPKMNEFCATRPKTKITFWGYVLQQISEYVTKSLPVLSSLIALCVLDLRDSLILGWGKSLKYPSLVVDIVIELPNNQIDTAHLLYKG